MFAVHRCIVTLEGAQKLMMHIAVMQRVTWAATGYYAGGEGQRVCGGCCSGVAGSHEVLLVSYSWRRYKPTLQVTAG